MTVLDAFELWCWRRLLRVPWTAGRSVLGVYWKDWCWSWNSSTLATSYKELTHWKRPWCWEGLGVGGEGDDRGWDGWMASPTQWTWVWVNSRSWWWTERPGMLWFMGSQRVRHNWATELMTVLQSFLVFDELRDFYWVVQLRPALCDPIYCSTPGYMSSTISQSLLKFMSVESVMLSNHLILCRPLLLQSFPASESFPVSQLFVSGGKVLELQLQQQSFQWIFRTDFL